MKALLSLIPQALSALKEVSIQDGKVKVTPAGMGIVLGLVAIGYTYFELRVIRAELSEVRVTSHAVWQALVARGIAQATPSPTPAPTLGGLLSPAEATTR